LHSGKDLGRPTWDWRGGRQGRLHEARLPYLEQSGKPWFILSTKYGLIEPGEKIEKYNVPVSRALADSAFLNRLGEQGRQLGLEKFDQLVLLDWERFQPLVRAAAGDSGVRCVLRKLLY